MKEKIYSLIPYCGKKCLSVSRYLRGNEDRKPEKVASRNRKTDRSLGNYCLGKGMLLTTIPLSKKEKKHFC